MQIIYINGIGGSGKDTFVEYCSKYAKVSLISTVDNVKKICKQSFDWNGIKDDKGRKLLASIRAVWAEYNDGPVNSIAQYIDEIKDQNICVLFVMVREFDEMIRMQNKFGGKTLNVLRQNIYISPTEQKFLDMVPSNYVYDYSILNNTGFDVLDLQAREFIKNLCNED